MLASCHPVQHEGGRQLIKGEVKFLVDPLGPAILLSCSFYDGCFPNFRKSRRHYDFGVHDLVTDSADTVS